MRVQGGWPPTQTPGSLVALHCMVKGHAQARQTALWAFSGGPTEEPSKRFPYENSLYQTVSNLYQTRIKPVSKLYQPVSTSEQGRHGSARRGLWRRWPRAVEQPSEANFLHRWCCDASGEQLMMGGIARDLYVTKNLVLVCRAAPEACGV